MEQNDSSSPRFYHFIKHGIPIKESTRNRRQFFDSLAVLNLNRKSEMFDNIDDKEINKNRYKYIITTQQSERDGKTLRRLSIMRLMHMM